MDMQGYKIKWDVVDLTRDIATGGVKVIHVSITSLDPYDDIIFEWRIGVDVKFDASAPNFIPFENLTREQTLAWAKAKIDSEAGQAPHKVSCDVWEQRMLKEIEHDLEKPKVSQGVPWVG